MNKTTRIKWIDTAKFLGIIAIYLGHITYLERFGQIDTSYNKIINFVFLYHVPFFFFYQVVQIIMIMKVIFLNTYGKK